jgi:hypothetical protein
MPKDRDQLTPDDPDDAEYLATHRGQGTGGTGLDQIGTGPEDLGELVATDDGAEPDGDAGSA